MRPFDRYEHVLADEVPVGWVISWDNYRWLRTEDRDVLSFRRIDEPTRTIQFFRGGTAKVWVEVPFPPEAT